MPETGGARPPSRRVLIEVDGRSLVAVGAALLLVAAVVALFSAAPQMLTRVAVGVVLALALDPVVARIRTGTGWGRRRCVGVVGIALFALVTVVVVLLGPPAVRQAAEFSAELPSTVEKLYKLPLVGPVLERNDARAQVQRFLDDLPATISDQTIASTADRLLGGLTSALIVVVITFAVLLDGEDLVARGRQLVPASRQEQADHIGRTVYRTVGRYFGGSMTVAVLMGVYVLAVGLVLGVPLAPLAAIWAMLTDLIPQIGGFLGGSLFIVLAFTAGVGVGLLAAVLFLAYMNLENHVIQPAIVGQAVDLSPPTTMLAALIGGAAAGVPGALVATPLVGAVKRLYLETRFGEQAIDAADRSQHRRLHKRLPFRRRRRPAGTTPPAVTTAPASGTVSPTDTRTDTV